MQPFQMEWLHSKAKQWSVRGLLEVDARRQLADTRIVGLGKDAAWDGLAGGGPCVCSTRPSVWTGPNRRVEDVEELAADLKGHAAVQHELLEERHIEQRVILLANVQEGAVGLVGIGKTLNEGRRWRLRIASRDGVAFGARHGFLRHACGVLVAGVELTQERPVWLSVIADDVDVAWRVEQLAVEINHDAVQLPSTKGLTRVSGQRAELGQ